VNIDLSFNQLVLATWKNGPSHYVIIFFQIPLGAKRFFSQISCAIHRQQIEQMIGNAKLFRP
jgi:hypothetical protein